MSGRPQVTIPVQWIRHPPLRVETTALPMGCRWAVLTIQNVSDFFVLRSNGFWMRVGVMLQQIQSVLYNIRSDRSIDLIWTCLSRIRSKFVLAWERSIEVPFSGDKTSVPYSNLLCHGFLSDDFSMNKWEATGSAKNGALALFFAIDNPSFVRILYRNFTKQTGTSLSRGDELIKEVCWITVQRFRVSVFCLVFDMWYHVTFLRK